MSRSSQPAKARASAIDWADLNNRIQGYTFVQCAAEEEDAIFCGLRLKMGEIAQKVNATAGDAGERIPFLFIFADTLTVDHFTLPCPSATIVARRIQLEKGDPLLAPEGDDVVSQVLILTSEVEGGRLRIRAEGGEEWSPNLEDPALKLPKAVTFVNSKREVSSALNIVVDRLRHPMAWNSFKAGFAAAMILQERNDSSSVATAMAILRWIHQCTRLVAKKPVPFQSEARDLNYQTGALMVQAGAKGGSTYVPLLSRDFYEERVRRLMAVVETHERKLGELQNLEAIDGATEKFSAALKDISAANVTAVDAAFENAMDEFGALREEYNRLLYGLYLQETDVNTAKLLFENELRLKSFWDIVQVLIGVASAVIGCAGSISAMATFSDVPEQLLLLRGIAGELGVDITDQAAVVGQVAENLSGLSSKIRAAVTNGFGKLGEVAGSLLVLQASIEVFVSAALNFQSLYDASNHAINQLQGDEGPEIELPDWEQIGTMDPDLEWNNYMAQMEASLASYMDVSGAAAYRSSLMVYTEYARALNRKAIAMARVQARAFEILAQKKAAQEAVERWEKLKTEAKNEAQKKAAMRALLDQQLTNAKRHLLVAARAYRAAFLYRFLSEPAMNVNLDMNHQQLAVEFANITTSVENLLGTGRPSQTFDTDSMRIPVVRARTEEAPENLAKGVYANLDTVDGKTLLTWSLPISHPPFAGKIPPNDHLALFIEEGWFYLEGARANPQGTIIVKVTTSGEYINGYGKALGFAPRSFSSAPLEMDFIYSLTGTGEFKEPPNTRWQPADEIRASYMKPTPFTHFALTIESAGSLDELSAVILRFRGVYQPVVRRNS